MSLQGSVAVGAGVCGNPPPPFLSKCYEMVEDPATNSTVSWTEGGDAFVVWDQPSFSHVLLPKYFKHNNFSSFVRQLNTYGFRKVDPDRWEFANDGFRKGQKNLLKTICRRKQNQSQVQQKQTLDKNTSVGACVEVGKFGLEEELERLKRDRNILMQELVKLRQHQQNSDVQLGDLRKRLQGMEQHQQQMLSFFVLAMQKPGFFAQLLQQNERLLTGESRKRRLPALEQGTGDDYADSGVQIVEYEPLKSENSKSLIVPVSDFDSTLRPVTTDGVNDLFENINFESLGINMSTPMDTDVHSPETDHALVFMELSNDELEQLLLSTSFAESGGPTLSGLLESIGGVSQSETSEQVTQSSTPQSLDCLTEQMGLLTSEMSKESAIV